MAAATGCFFIVRPYSLVDTSIYINLPKLDYIGWKLSFHEEPTPLSPKIETGFPTKLQARTDKRTYQVFEMACQETKIPAVSVTATIRIYF